MTVVVEAAPPVPASASQFTGTRRLVRLALRRDRIQLSVWVISIVLFMLLVVASVTGLYSTPEELRNIAVSSAVSPVALATNGIVSGDSQGAIVASQSVLVFALVAALMSTLAVVRHTRQNEETGRAEMIGAAVVGRRALLTSALIVTVGANVVLALGIALGSIAVGLPVVGSFALGASIGGTGIAFAGVAAVTAQITDGARTANGLAGAAIGVAFMLRAIGDVNSTVVDDGTRVVSGWLSWLSPIGWAQQIRPFDDDAWWILLLLIGFAAVHVVVAFVLIGHRDQGAGLVQPPRPGPPVAASWLPSAWGLAWRMQRMTMFWWIFAVVILGFAYGAVGNEIDAMVGSSQQTAEMFAKLGGGGSDLVDSYLATALGLTSIVIAAYSVQSLLRMRGRGNFGTARTVAGNVFVAVEVDAFPPGCGCGRRDPRARLDGCLHRFCLRARHGRHRRQHTSHDWRRVGLSACGARSRGVGVVGFRTVSDVRVGALLGGNLGGMHRARATRHVAEASAGSAGSVALHSRAGCPCRAGDSSATAGNDRCGSSTFDSITCCVPCSRPPGVGELNSTKNSTKLASPSSKSSGRVE